MAPYRWFVPHGKGGAVPIKGKGILSYFIV